MFERHKFPRDLSDGFAFVEFSTIIRCSTQVIHCRSSSMCSSSILRLCSIQVMLSWFCSPSTGKMRSLRLSSIGRGDAIVFSLAGHISSRFYSLLDENLEISTSEFWKLEKVSSTHKRLQTITVQWEARSNFLGPDRTTTEILCLLPQESWRTGGILRSGCL